MACTFYEPAHVAIEQWFGGRQGRPLGVLTLLAGLSATIFIPLTQRLVEDLGWRARRSRWGAVTFMVIGSLVLLVVRDRPREEARAEHVDLRGMYEAMAAGLRRTTRVFWLISAAYFLGLTATFLMLCYQVAYLQDLGFPAGRVAAAIGDTGVISLPGRFSIPVLGDHVRPPLLVTAIFAFPAISALLLFEAGEWWRSTCTSPCSERCCP